MGGTFDVTLNTPIGSKKGILTMIEQNGMLSGSIRAMGRTNSFSNGRVNGNSFEFSGLLDMGLFRIRYTAKGTVEGNTLKATAATDAGTFRMSGTRIG